MVVVRSTRQDDTVTEEPKDDDSKDSIRLVRGAPSMAQYTQEEIVDRWTHVMTRAAERETDDQLHHITNKKQQSSRHDDTIKQG